MPSPRLPSWFGPLVAGAAGVVLGSRLAGRRRLGPSVASLGQPPPAPALASGRGGPAGLVDRATLLEACGRMQAAAAHDRARLAVVVVDLDRFGDVRESASPDGADELVRLLGQRLVERSPASALVAHTGDQELVVAAPLPVRTAEADAVALAEAMLDVVHGADRRGRADRLTASVGVTLADDETVAGLTLLEDARLAVVEARERGRDQVALFDQCLRRANDERRATLDAIRRGLDEGEFRVLYQPEVDLADGRLVGVEALVRWERPGHGLLPPADFLDLAERNGLITELGSQVLDQALGQLATWLADGASLVMGVNVSAQQLVSEQFVTTVADAIARHRVPPACVRIELTETSLLVDPAVAARALGGLRALGAQLALDDFGAGYASIGYLRSLPVDLLKIDQSFVAGLPGDEHDLAIVGFVVGMADALGLEVTAEGIERQDQADALLSLGCRHGQGYLFDRPVPPEQIAPRLSGRWPERST